MKFKMAICIFLSSIALAQTPMARESATSDPSAAMEEALKAYKSQNWDQAQEKFSAIVLEYPKSEQAWTMLVRALLKKEMVKEASEKAKQAAIEIPNSYDIQTALGEVYYRQGLIADADKTLVAVVNSDDSNARAYYVLAKIRRAISMYKKSREFIDKAHDLDPHDPDIMQFWFRSLIGSERGIQMREHNIRIILPSDETKPAQHEKEKQPGEAIIEKPSANSTVKPGSATTSRRCTLVNQIDTAQMNLEPMMLDAYKFYGYGLKVSFNGKSAQLLLDTGASGLLIKRSLAEKAGIQSVGHTDLGGIGDKGPTSGYIGFADSIRIGNLEFKNCPVRVSETRSVVGDDGLIGADVFADYLISLDLSNGKLKLGPLPKRPDDSAKNISLKTEEDEDSGDDAPEIAASPDASFDKTKASAGPQDRYVAPEMANYVRMFRYGHQLLIPTKVGDAPWKLFLIDTGASMNSITPETAKLVTKVHNDNDTIIKGISGKVNNVYSADKAIIQFSHYRQVNQDMVTMDLGALSRAIGVEVSGILGFNTLHMFEVHIDYRDGLIDFIYDDKRFGRN